MNRKERLMLVGLMALVAAVSWACVASATENNPPEVISPLRSQQPQEASLDTPAGLPPATQARFIEENTYKLNLFGRDSSGQPLRVFGMCHAWACDETPGYLVSCAHAFIGRAPDGTIKPLSEEYEWDAEPGHGKHLTVRVSYLHLEYDVAFLQIMHKKFGKDGKQTWPAGLALGTAPRFGAEARICSSENGDPRLGEPVTAAGIVRWTAPEKKGRDPVDFHTVVATAFHGQSGAPVIQDGKVVMQVLRKADNITAGIRAQVIRDLFALYKQGEHYKESWRVAPGE